MPIPIKKTRRGFNYGEFTDVNGVKCSIQKSSVATEDLIWFGVDDPNPMIFPGNNTGWHPYKLPRNVQCTTRMHLSREMAKEILPVLKHFAKTGELPLKRGKTNG